MERGIAGTLDLDGGGDFFEGADIVGGEVDFGRAEIFFEALQLRGAGDGTIQGFCASSQARAICAGVAWSFRPNSVMTSTRA